ncbi:MULTISPECIES: SDR family NAD(P)-dependent oxidoreductase [Mycobacteriaceae]|uniref:3-oxoacyl-[acyl-carrier-protein] reductase MabA n=6 Tax=Mycobacteriaceae TaxID=1762 RepID=A0A132PEM7_9MYCO|nr:MULTISPECIES: 3-oxoacyl-ACP reductase family protein [Mycobacteriaceae]MDZ4266426.1 3-oxoacyl-ACP reductase family protein [Mycobacterium sp.]MEE3066429.1 3-oxoacyl-ACP reductase family protein [Actinomycetota bacterium]KLI04842.1 2-hydroxycyclohexanecarboxyl-CoA dehydrogenase [Mycolicibacterium senegalense]KLO47518.1 2-hydroxycyclohexanecarboxyl-CoA dehydrogenase [Mycolicibacterium senegalense]KMV13911.1 2-hydroxycyclohexanecarboxyl-CoA dehydrogenase [Mycolicibacterium conceptionense]
MQARVAVVTGAARGIGREIALALGRQGRHVAVVDLRDHEAKETAATITAAGGTAVPVAVDVTDPASVKEGLNEVRQKLGSISILVNNAGWDELKPFVDTDEEFWQRVIEINYKGVLRTTHDVLPAMIEAGWGRIVNIGSDAGRVGSSLESVYSGAKGAVIAFTKTIAREVARAGVTANTVCPGPTDTPLLQEIVRGQADADKVIGAMTRAVPMKRLGRPEEVAAAVAFLASDDAGFITGQTLSVSGGLTMA